MLASAEPFTSIFSQGQSSDAVYYVQEGKVRLSVLSKQGKEATIALLGPGDFLGQGCIASDQPIRLATAAAITNCTLLRIHKKEMLRALHTEQLSLTCSLHIWLNGTTVLRQT